MASLVILIEFCQFGHIFYIMKENNIWAIYLLGEAPLSFSDAPICNISNGLDLSPLYLPLSTD